eukprot:IDg6851t1
MSTESAHNDVLPPRKANLHLSEAPLTIDNTQPLELDVDSGAAGGAWTGNSSGWSQGGGGSGDSSDNSGGRGRDGGDRTSDEALTALLRSKNASLSDVPSDVLRAYQRGLIGLHHVGNLLAARANVFSRYLMTLGGGMRNRFLADKLFLLKIAIEEGIGVFGKLSAEWEQRRERFWVESEFVFANLLSAVLADFALVYLPAPSVRLTTIKTGSGFGHWLASLTASLPTGVFQSDRPFTLAQRAAGFSLKATQLLAVGFACSFAGIVFTNGIVALRERFDKNYTAKTQKQNIFFVPMLYGIFLGVSSGSRYQLVNGIEGHIFPRMFKHAPKLAEEVATFALRYCNTFWGSQQWVMFCKFTNAQKLKEN